MRSGLTFPVLAESLRALFVEVAVTDLLPDAKSRTDSRISLMTGIHRKDIRRLRASNPDNDFAPIWARGPKSGDEPGYGDAPDVVTLASRIVARWVGSPAFCDGAGRPLALPRAKQAPDGPSFEALVEAITTDIRPRAVLDDLVMHAVVYMDASDRVQLNADAFIPRPGGEEQLFYFARNLHDHVAAAVMNISAAEAPRFLDRSVHYDRLSPDQARELEDFARGAAMRALLDVNRKALELTDSVPDACPAEARRVNFGVYVFDASEATANGGVA